MDVLFYRSPDLPLAELDNLLAEQELTKIDVETLDDVIALLANENPPRIVLAEYTHGEFLGVELINAVLATELHSYPFILFIVSNQNSNQVVDALGPIPGDFLVPPFSAEEFKARLLFAERAIATQDRLMSSGNHSESLAIYDNLTGVLNRQAVYERALEEHNRALREKIGMSIAILDIENLDEIREKYGAVHRDQTLRFIARVARSNVRLYDVVGRWMGSKFFILLPGATREAANVILNRISGSIKSIRIRVSADETVEPIVKIGVASANQDSTQPLYMLIEEANDALLSLHGKVSDPLHPTTRPLD